MAYRNGPQSNIIGPASHDQGICSLARFRVGTPEQEKLLGSAPDAEVARLLGRTERGVQLRRQMLGVQLPAARRGHWKPEEDALLGRKPDREVARLLGRPLASVQIRRHLKGIRNPAPLRKSWTPNEDALLSTLSDDEVAKNTGRSLCAVANRRKSLCKN